MSFDPDLDWLRTKPGCKWHDVEGDVLPAWVADMDFAPPPAVRAALEDYIAGGDLGYPTWVHEPTPVREAFASRMRQRFGWSPDPGHVREFSDVIQALQVVLHVATHPRDAVAVLTPCYPPFLEALSGSGRRLVPVPVSPETGWTFDVETLERDVERSNARVLLLVNPHNPSGRALRRDELEALAGVARDHELLVVSDEIHADLTYAPHTHIPFATLSEDSAGRTVTLTSATKAFNLAAIKCAVAHIGSAAVRYALATQPPFLFGEVSQFGVSATLAAWQASQDWLDHVLEALDAGRARLAEALRPLGIGYDPPEATYLAWLDCRGLDLGADPAAFFLDKARVRLSPGPDYGPGGDGFARLNFATSPRVLDEICERMAAALANR